MGTLVSYQLKDSVAAITMDDGKVNVMSTAMQTGLNEALDRAEADGAVVLLRGRDGVFSAGFDLNVLRERGPDAATMVRGGFELAYRVLSFPQPVVVACTGHAIAMGAFLLLSGDYRVGAAGPFKFVANEVAIGLTLPQAAVEVLRARLTPSAFGRAAILSETFTPDNAVESGFLDRVVARLGRARRMPARWRPLCPRWTVGPCRQQAPGRHDTLVALRAAHRATRPRANWSDPDPAVPQTQAAHQPELRDQVLRVAVGTLAADGVRGFTTRAVAEGAATSVPAVYELFGDKAGLVREMFFEGFRQLRRRFDELADTDDPRADLGRAVGGFRSFVRRQPAAGPGDVLATVRRLRPGPAEARGRRRGPRSSSSGASGGASTPACCRRPTDIAHTLLALAQGLAAQEAAGWLGRSRPSVDRRWAVGLRAALDGFRHPSTADR